jgi:hypothetical protein
MERLEKFLNFLNLYKINIIIIIVSFTLYIVSTNCLRRVSKDLCKPMEIKQNIMYRKLKMFYKILSIFLYAETIFALFWFVLKLFGI